MRQEKSESVFPKTRLEKDFQSTKDSVIIYNGEISNYKR